MSLAEKTMDEYPNSVCFASKLIFRRVSFLTAWLHNQTPVEIQSRLHLQGKQMVLLPMNVSWGALSGNAGYRGQCWPLLAARQAASSSGLCVVSQSRGARSMRACQPGPVAWKASSTSGDQRTVTDSFVGAFCGPRPRRFMLMISSVPSS